MLDENTQLYEEYFSMRSVSPKTQSLYYSALLNWDITTKTPIQTVKKTSLIKWYKEVSKDKAPSTIEKYAQLLRIFYQHHLESTGLSKRTAQAQAEDMFDTIPFSDLNNRKNKEANLRDKVITPAEFQALMDSTGNIKLRALIAVTYESGCRKGEIYSLRLKDVSVNPDHWTLTVMGKTGTRTVPIVKSIPFLKAWIQQHPDRENADQWLFTRINKGKIRKLGPNSFNDSLIYLSSRAGLRKIYPHQLRHTRLTKLAEDGLGEFQMKSFAGWTADSKMASQYVHLSGRGHVNAVLEAEGLSVEHHQNESISLIEMSRCPNCDEPVDPAWVQCPSCRFVLSDRLGISRQDDMAAMKAKLDRMEKALSAIYKETKTRS